MRSFFTTSLLFLIAFASGCARYEYQIIRPPEVARHVGKTEETVQLEPLEYRFVTVDNRLVIRIFNHTEDTIQLRGSESAAVDPGGQSHPLRDVSIAPASFTKLILPPLRPYVEHQGPTFGIGVGVGYSRADHGRGIGAGVGNEFYDDEPRYYGVYEDGSAYYWTWEGDAPVRLSLAYERNGKTFRDEFTIARQKM